MDQTFPPSCFLGWEAQGDGVVLAAPTAPRRDPAAPQDSWGRHLGLACDSSTLQRLAGSLVVRLGGNCGSEDPNVGSGGRGWGRPGEDRAKGPRGVGEVLHGEQGLLSTGCRGRHTALASPIIAGSGQGLCPQIPQWLGKKINTEVPPGTAGHGPAGKLLWAGGSPRADCRPRSQSPQGAGWREKQPVLPV